MSNKSKESLISFLYNLDRINKAYTDILNILKSGFENTPEGVSTQINNLTIIINDEYFEFLDEKKRWSLQLMQFRLTIHKSNVINGITTQEDI